MSGIKTKRKLDMINIMHKAIAQSRDEGKLRTASEIRWLCKVIWKRLEEYRAEELSELANLKMKHVNEQIKNKRYDSANWAREEIEARFIRRELLGEKDWSRWD